MDIKFPINHLMGYIIQVAEYKCSVPILLYENNDLLCGGVYFVSTCPVLQARSHTLMCINLVSTNFVY